MLAKSCKSIFFYQQLTLTIVIFLKVSNTYFLGFFQNTSQEQLLIKTSVITCKWIFWSFPYIGFAYLTYNFSFQRLISKTISTYFLWFDKLTFKDIHREKASLTKTPALTKNMNMDFWIVGTSNQLFRGSSYNETKFSKK